MLDVMGETQRHFFTRAECVAFFEVPELLNSFLCQAHFFCCVGSDRTAISAGVIKGDFDAAQFLQVSRQFAFVTESLPVPVPGQACRTLKQDT